MIDTVSATDLPLLSLEEASGGETHPLQITLDLSTSMEERVMRETHPVNLELRLPQDIVEQLEEIQRTDPEFMSRLVLYGLARRSIFHELRDRPSAFEAPLESRPITM